MFSLFLIKDNGFYINDFILWCKGQGPAWKTTYPPREINLNGSDVENEVFEEEESEESDYSSET